MTAVRLIDGNTKLGPAVKTLSLLPVLTCDPSAPCTHTAPDRKRSDCYSCKFIVRPSVRSAWQSNTDFALSDTPAFFRSLYAQLYLGTPPTRFRWFVGGDAPSLDFCRRIIELADRCSRINFLAFTKRYDWFSCLRFSPRPDIRPTFPGYYRPHPTYHSTLPWPPNLCVIFSAWPDYPLRNPYEFPVAWMRDPDHPDPRIPSNAFECSGSCEDCDRCWNAPFGSHVVFHKH